MPTANPSQDYPGYIASESRKRGLDPAAVLAVASFEGGFIPAPGHYDPDTHGNPGYSYGPFQLRSPGKFPTSQFPGSDTSASDAAAAWAWSPAGIQYALNGIQKVAGNLGGRAAIMAIVSKFEQPADIPREVRNAAGAYKNYQGYATGSEVSLGGGEIIPGSGNIGDVGTSPTAAAQHIPGVVQAESVAKFLGHLTDPSYLLRGGEIIAGAVLVFGGLFLLAKQIGLAPDIKLPAVVPVPV